MIEILDAAYSAAGTDQEWIEQLASAAYPILHQGLGMSVFTYDASGTGSPRVTKHAGRGLPPDFDAPATAESLPAQHVPEVFACTPPVVLLSELAGGKSSDQFVERTHHPFGIRDVIAIRGGEPSRRGCGIAIPLSRSLRLPARRRGLLARVAAHLASGWRLRQSFAGLPERGLGQADAIFSARGKLEHLGEGLDVGRDGEKLQASVERLRQVKQACRLDPDAALELWQALVDGRWSIVQRTDTDGKRYLLARRNAPEVRDAASLLPREALVAAYAALGHPSKLIAYELGIPESSLSTLLKQAMQKLGAKSRAELAVLFGA